MARVMEGERWGEGDRKGEIWRGRGKKGEGEREREGGRERVYVCVCVCVRVLAREGKNWSYAGFDMGLSGRMAMTWQRLSGSF